MSADFLNLIWRLAIVAAVTLAVSFAWAFVAAVLSPWDKPFRSDADSASIRPWPPLWWVMTGFLGLVVIGGVASGLYSDSTPMLLTMLAIGAGLGFLVWMSFLMCLPNAEVSWNDHGVSGPTSSFSLGRRELSWANIVRVRRSGGGNAFEDARGDRIVWSDFHVGARFLWGFLLHKRPDLSDQLTLTQ
jgi:hypothetical protein